MKSRIDFKKFVNKIFTATLVAIVFSAVSFPVIAATGIARVISYQGRLVDAAGQNVADGSYNLKLAVYDAVSGGSCIWSAANTDANTGTVDCGAPGSVAVSVTGGLFTVLLGDTANGQNALPSAVYGDDARFLGVTVNADTEMVPRRQLTAVYQSLNALNLNSLATSAVGGAYAFIPATDSSGNLALTQNLNIGGTVYNSQGVSAVSSLTVASGGSSDLVLTSGSGTLHLGAGTNLISNSDVGTDLTLSARGQIKIADGKMLVLGSAVADPAGAVDGASYYNSLTNERRCFVAGIWGDCNRGSGWDNEDIAGFLQMVNLGDQVGIGTSLPLADTKMHVAYDNATNNDIANVVTLDHTTSGVASNGIGIGINFRNENSLGTTTDSGHLNSIFTNASSGNETSAFTFETRNAGGPVLERLRLTAAGLLPALTDNAEDLGAGGNQWRNGYLGTSLVINANTVLGDGALSTSVGNIALQPAGTGTTGYVHIGAGQTGSTTPDLLALDVKSDAGDPATGDDGSMYYNENSNKFRCRVNGSWTDCDTTGGTVALQNAYNNGATITTAAAVPIQFALASGNFNASGAGAVNLTPTAASQFVSGGALTFTAGAASTWGTTAGDLRLVAAGSGTGNIVIGSGMPSSTPDLLMLDIKNNSAVDPAGIDGAMYYNSSSGFFRCHEAGGWKNCDTGVAAGSLNLQQVYNNGGTITTASASDIAFVLSSGNLSVTGAGSVNLTPTAASQFVSGGALTFTAGAASTWGTTAGDLSLQVSGVGTTANVQIGAGGAGSATPDLLVLDAKSSAGDPTGVNGAMYYNVNVDKMRCYENSAWKDCDRSAVATMQQVYTNGSTITTASSTPITFALASGNFNASGTGAVNLTPTAASQFTSGAALTLTAGAASTWGTTAGNLSLQVAGIGMTANVQIGAGGAGSATPDLLVIDATSAGFGSGDPVGGVNGATYYNNSLNKIRCFENGAWKDCDAGIPLSVGLAKGDLIAYSSSNIPARLPISGTNGFILMADSSQATGMKWAPNVDAANATDFAQLSDTMTVDASTTIAMNSKNLTINDVAGSGTLAMAPGGALTLTAGSASTWSTATGNLTIQSGSGTLSLGTTNALSVSGGLAITTGGASSFSTSTGAITLQASGAGTSSTVNIGVGGAGSTTPDLLALDVKSTAGNPAGISGAMYYNANADKFMCYEAGSWQTCLGTWTENGTVNLMKNSADQLQIGANVPPAGTKADISLSDASNNSSSNVLVLDHATTGTAGNGIGSGMLFRNQNGNGTMSDAGSVSAVLDNASVGTEDSSLRFFTRAGGSALVERLRVTNVGNINPATTNNSLDIGSIGNVWRTLRLGTSAVIGGTTYGDASASSTGAFSLVSGGSGALTFSSGSGILTLAAGTNRIANTDAGTDLVLDGSRNVKIDDTSLLVLSSAAANPSAPPATNGAIYYNNASDKFRCYQGGAWVDCITTSSLQSAYNAGNSVTTSGSTPILFTLTSGNFNVTGTGSVNLTPAGASQFTSASSLTLTAGSASTWSTSSGALTVDSAAALNLGTTSATAVSIGRPAGTFALASTGLNATTAGALTGVTSIDTISTSATAITFAGAGNITTTTSSAITLDSGTTGIVNIGTGNNAKTINVGTGASGNTINIGTNNTVADNIAIGSALDSLTLAGVNWSITSAGLITTVGNISLSSTTPSLSIGNTGTLVVNDGTNALLSVIDQGTYGTVKLSDKGSTADPATCTAGEMYFNGTDRVFKGCTATNTWTSLSQNDNAKITTATANQALTNVNTSAAVNVTITPKSATSQVLLNGYVTYVPGNTTITLVTVQVRRGTLVSSPLVASSMCGTGNVYDSVCAWSWLDNPATTSATTYSIWVQGSVSNGNIANRSNLAMEVRPGADLAEMYGTNDSSISLGDVVNLDSAIISGVKKSAVAYDNSVIGVVSTEPSLVMGSANYEGTKAVPVALAGRVPVKVTDENGAIKAGDYLAASSKSGLAMKATRPGMVIGMAMSDGPAMGDGIVLVFVKNTYYGGSADSGLAVGASAPVSDVDVLAGLVSGLATRPVDNVPVDLNADRLVAGLSVVAPTGVFNGLRVDSIGSIGAILGLMSDVNFFGRPYFNSDTAGFAKIFSGSDHVDVIFDKEYSAPPVVNATVSLENIDDASARLATEQGILQNDVRFIVTRVGVKGFTILLKNQANSDVSFAWTAFAVRDAKVFHSSASVAPLVAVPPASQNSAIEAVPEIPVLSEPVIETPVSPEPAQPATETPAVPPEPPQAETPAPAVAADPPLSDVAPASPASN